MIGSCFTEHIGNKLMELKFDSMQNPHGILFGVPAIHKAFEEYRSMPLYENSSLFLSNEIYYSWQHHSLFSGTNPEVVAEKINLSNAAAHDFLKESAWTIITLGTSFSYYHIGEGMHVANCHKVSQREFNKELLSVGAIKDYLQETIATIRALNPGNKIVFTISPVRHIRDGVVENNRSKARLIEVVHDLINGDDIFYFPAYEIVIDVLRDYRFYDVDMVHPNYLATEFVMERFIETYLDADTKTLSEELKRISIAQKHRPQHPDTKAHRYFVQDLEDKIQAIKLKYPYIRF
ncbi:MAG: GSCFA domain-containing protein [Bacteroidetes bacterium]|nr:GSCFA domain-containing protein [Bacteroidota bacterium]